MKITITSARTVEIDLRATPYAEWPEEARTAARHILEREMRKRQSDLFIRERLIELVEQHLATSYFDF